MEKEASRIKQEEKLSELLRHYKNNDMVTVYYVSKECTDKGVSYPAIHSALLPQGNITDSLNSKNWNMMYDGGQPYVEKYMDGKNSYLRFGNDDGYEPLVISRNFFDIFDNFLEVSEEFRLYHNLYYNQPSGEFLKVLEDGGTEKVITFNESDGLVQIRWKELSEFLSVKDMVLAVFFDFIEYSVFSLQELSLQEGKCFEIKDDSTFISAYISSCKGVVSNYKSSSKLIGKRIITPSDFTIADTSSCKRFIDFIVDTDKNGNEIEHTCDESELKNMFGQNPDAFSYLTPIYFKKSVLDKYYNEPSKYEVNDARLSCGSLWSIYIDNDHKDKVCVWLGDLSNLSYTEQSYWRSFNIVPDGHVSSVFYKRQIQAQFANSEQPEHVFISVYNQLLQESLSKIGWSVILPLAKDDEHFLKSIRLPTTNEQKVFDELVLSLTKVLIDSINEKELQKIFKLLNQDGTELKGSISKIKHLFDLLSLQDYEEVINFLRGLQKLRSTSSAHRKGSQYQKVAKDLGILENGRVKTFNNLLKQSIDYLVYLRTHVVEALVDLNNSKDTPHNSA